MNLVNEYGVIVSIGLVRFRILNEIVKGNSIGKIANILGIRRDTVKFHCRQLRELKLIKVEKIPGKVARLIATTQSSISDKVAISEEDKFVELLNKNGLFVRMGLTRYRVLRKVRLEHSRREIARALGLSTDSIKKHCAALRKLGFLKLDRPPGKIARLVEA